MLGSLYSVPLLVLSLCKRDYEDMFFSRFEGVGIHI